MFWFAKGKLRRVYDESLDAAEELQRGDSGAFRLEAIDWGRRISIEKDIQGNEEAPSPNAIFDESGNFIIYATLLGIKAWFPSSASPEHADCIVSGHVVLGRVRGSGTHLRCEGRCAADKGV